MAKTRISFLCGACGAVQPKWLGRCPECGGWNTLERFTELPLDDEADTHDPYAAHDADGADGAGAVGASHAPGAADHDRRAARARANDPRTAAPRPLSEISAESTPRVASGIAELDRVLGGGLVPGSTILLGGEPGIGKSTLLLQALLSIAQRGHRALYATSEESAHQVKLRADRLAESEAPDRATSLTAEGGSTARRSRGDRSPSETALADRAPTELLLHADSVLDRILEHARKLRPAVLAIDSIQLVARSGLDASPGSVTQLRRCCLDLVHFAKRSGCTVIMVGHVTKEGVLSGPKMLEHMVDAVLAFEGDRHHLHRVVRATKNRYGSTQEVGLFEMTGIGLVEVDDTALALSSAEEPRPGSALVATLAGSRAMLAEIQALTATGFLGSAKRKTSGVDSSRANMLIAVLEKHAGLRLADQDIYIACGGGLKVSEPAVDLGLALAVAGSHLRRALPALTAVMGEISLSGEIRAVRQLDARIEAARRRGIKTIVVPAAQSTVSPKGRPSAARAATAAKIPGVELVPVARISDAINLLSPSLVKS